jgi:hypothetical protein
MIGSSSLLLTGLPRATFVVPAGAKNGGRGLPNGFSRFSTLVSCGVSTNMGFGNVMSSGTSLNLSLLCMVAIITTAMMATVIPLIGFS